MIWWYPGHLRYWSDQEIGQKGWPYTYIHKHIINTASLLRRLKKKNIISGDFWTPYSIIFSYIICCLKYYWCEKECIFTNNYCALSSKGKISFKHCNFKFLISNFVKTSEPRFFNLIFFIYIVYKTNYWGQFKQELQEVLKFPIEIF